MVHRPVLSPAIASRENPPGRPDCARIIRRPAGFSQATPNHKERSMSIKRHGVGPRLSQAVVHGNTVYLAGIVAADPSADAKGQTEQILKKIDEHLAATGSHKSKLLSATIYLANMALYGDMNSVWDAWVDPSNTPARATVEARLATPRYLVEIMVVAAI
jgi:enamine deaminase RidA (YjgF/YER057c/UK114 family)